MLMSCSTDDWRSPNGIQAVFTVASVLAAVVSILATLVIGLVGYRVSINQIKPFLYIDVTSGKDHTIILLKNEGLGPAKITKVSYRLKARDTEEYRECASTDAFEGWRVDTEQCRDRGDCQYLLAAKGVIPGANLKQCLSSEHPYWQTCDVAGQVIGGGKEIYILHAYIKYDPLDPYGGNSRLGKLWQAALRYKLAHAEVKIEYEDANGRTIKPPYTSKLLFAPPNKQEEEMLKELFKPQPIGHCCGRRSSAGDQQQHTVASDVATILGRDHAGGMRYARPADQTPPLKPTFGPKVVHTENRMLLQGQDATRGDQHVINMPKALTFPTARHRDQDDQHDNAKPTQHNRLSRSISSAPTTSSDKP